MRNHIRKIIPWKMKSQMNILELTKIKYLKNNVHGHNWTLSTSEKKCDWTSRKVIRN